MDFNEIDKFGIDKSSGDHLNFHSSNALPDWQFAGADISSLFQLGNSIPVSSICSSVPMVNSFCPNILSHPSSQNLAFVRNQTRTSNSLPVEDARIGPTSTISSAGVGWTPPNLLQKGDVFLQTGAGNLPSNLLKFPIDSGFIERAARYSCFNGGNFRDMVNPFSIAETLSPQSKGGEIETTEVLLSRDLKFLPRDLSEKNELPTNEVSKGGRSPIDHGINEGSTERNEKECGSLLRSLDEGRHGIGMSCNEHEEAESSGAGLEEPSSVEKSIGEPSNSGLATKKRRRSDQDSELDHFKGDARLADETTKGLMETKQKDQQTPTLATHKPNSKHGKDIPQNSDAPKEDYIHVRARRGQATNSHSLAERVRREKISERMKFLQDLVPGCSKVTGKAVMLDEIINYVQSLQRQVEFLSMKLSTVSPSLHFNIEGLLSKDIHQMCSSTSTTCLLPDIHMAHPQLHPSQHGLLTSGIPGTGNPSDLLQRIINSQMTAVDAYKDPITQMSNVWDDELHNVLRMSFNSNIPISTQELNGSPPPGHMKVEP